MDVHVINGALNLAYCILVSALISNPPEILSRTSVVVCNLEHGARGARAISTILPVLLEHGITSGLVEVRTSQSTFTKFIVL